MATNTQKLLISLTLGTLCVIGLYIVGNNILNEPLKELLPNVKSIDQSFDPLAYYTANTFIVLSIGWHPSESTKPQALNIILRQKTGQHRIILERSRSVNKDYDTCLSLIAGDEVRFIKESPESTLPQELKIAVTYTITKISN